MEKNTKQVVVAAIVLALALGGMRAEAQDKSTFTPLGNTCVIFDSRSLANSPLNPDQSIFFAARGVCGIPMTANAVHVNVIVLGNPGYGSVRVFDGGTFGTNTFPVMWWRPNDSTRVSLPVILCQPVLECFGSDLGVTIQGTNVADIVITAEGYYEPVKPELEAEDETTEPIN